MYPYWKRHPIQARIVLVLAIPVYIVIGMLVGVVDIWHGWRADWREACRP